MTEWKEDRPELHGENAQQIVSLIEIVCRTRDAGLRRNHGLDLYAFLQRFELGENALELHDNIE